MQEFDLRYPSCPVRNVLSRFSDKWSLLTLRCINKNEKIRYKDIRKAIPDISQKMLSVTLKHLEEDHLIIREAYAEIPPRVEYSLSETGRNLMPALQMLINWSLEHFDEVTK
jgi:DNA-binding HxlR family transcriptional regulator